MDNKHLQKELHNIFVEEFNESFHNILTISKDEFTHLYIHRINIILNSYYPKLIPELRKNKNLFSKEFKTILEDYYLPCIYLSDNIIKKKKSGEKLYDFQRHCQENTEALHSCQGELLIIKDDKNTKKYVICSNCNYIYNMDCILMYCPIDDCEFYSKFKLINENSLKPVTWLKYHCPIMLNQQMNCPKCKNGLFLLGKDVYCPKCKYEKNPLDIQWKCILCHKVFSSDVKEYNPLEFLAMKISVKNSLVNQLIVKPLILPCGCDNNPLKLDFFHNKKCKGILYEGKRFEKKIIVCSLCKVFASINKFMWICPICGKGFKSANVRSFKHEINFNNDEFNLEINNNNNNNNKDKEKEKDNKNKEDNKDKDNDSSSSSSDEYVNIKSNNKEDNNKKEENDKEKKEEEIPRNRFKRRKSRHLSLLLKEKEAEEHKKQLQYLLPNLKEINGHLFQNGKKININLFKPLLTDRFNGGLFYNPPIQNLSPRLRKPIKRSETNSGNHYLANSLHNKLNDFKKEKQNINVINSNLILHNSEENSLLENENNKSDYEENNLAKSQHLFGTNQIKKKENKKLDNLIFDEVDYNVITQLGEGSFGKIYLVEDKEKNLFCMKKMITTNKKNFEEISKEYDVFAKYKHDNILSILGISKKMLDESTFCIYILMEVAKTDWEKEINQRQMRNKYYTEEELINILKQLVSALSFLQKNKVSHRDVKAQNILVFPNNKYKIADFGEARKYGKIMDPLSTLRGTELYMSPILFHGLQNRIFDINHNPYKSDVFSLGMCVLFASTLRIKTLCKIREFNNDSKLKIFIMSVISQRYSLSFVQLITQMLMLQEVDRPDFIELESMLEEF